MAYSDFTVTKVKQDFGITTIEGQAFFPPINPVSPSQTLVDFLVDDLGLKQINRLLSIFIWMATQ